MADFTTNMTGTAQVDDSVVQAYAAQFLIAANETQTMDDFATVKEDIGAKSITITKFGLLVPTTTALNEREDVGGSAMSDSGIVITPKEFGDAVTTTALANLQSGGKVDVAAAKLAAIQATQSQSKLACVRLAASSNVVSANAAGVASIVGTDVMTPQFMNIVYNKLARKNVPFIGSNMYVAVMHDDVIHDLRNATGAGSWMDVQKYTNADTILRNEVGSIAGFRIIRNNLNAPVADEGAGAVDNYYSIFLGFNGLGKAVSKQVALRLTGPFDKLARLVNIGWYGVYDYSIVDTDAVFTGVTASSLGVNA
jgi:N4-gp56 family major capsid protein